MKSVPLFKYTSYGNNFVIIDETRSTILNEAEKSRFAYEATDVHFGVGSDNLLIIQPCTNKVLAEINDTRQYWDNIPDLADADYILRMFEPTGVEAYCCANGLLCIADYLNAWYGIESARIVTEIPTARPQVVSIGSGPKEGTSWANLGHPKPVPAGLAVPSMRRPHDDTIDIVESIPIRFRKHDLAPFSEDDSLQITGFLVSTGEPHLVIFTDTGSSSADLLQRVFMRTRESEPQSEVIEKRAAFGSWLVHHIGSYLNNAYAHLFPSGINVNFARIGQEAGVFEYRCFERGINRETLSCGTGALAVSYVARRLNLLESDQIVAWPHRCRWNIPDARLLVKAGDNGWTLHGSPWLLLEGRFPMREGFRIIPDFEKPVISVPVDDPEHSDDELSVAI